MAGKEESGSSKCEDDAPQIYCGLCKLGFSGILPYKQHVRGSKHKNAEETERMKKKYGVRPKETSGKTKTADANSPSSPVATVQQNENAFTCDICQRTCSGFKSYQNHLVGSAHAKEVRKQKVLENLRASNLVSSDIYEPDDENDSLFTIAPQLAPFAKCIDCHKEFTGPESYQIHMTSPIHKKAVRSKNVYDNFLQKQGVVIDRKEKEVNREGILEESQQVFALCKGCEKSFSGPVPYAQHLKSKVHKKKGEQNKILASLVEQFPDTLNIQHDSDEDDYLVCKVCDTCFCGPENARTHLFSKKHQTAVTEINRLKKLNAESNIEEASKELPNKSLQVENTSNNMKSVNSQSVQLKTSKNVTAEATETQDFDDFTVI